MKFMIECIRGRHWRARHADGKLLLCETTTEAAETLRRLIAEGEQSVRARSGLNVYLWGCRNPDGSATIGGRSGISRKDLTTPTC